MYGQIEQRVLQVIWIILGSSLPVCLDAPHVNILWKRPADQIIPPRYQAVDVQLQDQQQ